MIVQHRECIHWDICSRACPLETSECKYFRLNEPPRAGKWIRIEGTNSYQCSSCNTIGAKTDHFCKTCGSQNVVEEE